MCRCAWHNFQFDRTNHGRVIALELSKYDFENVVSQTTSTFLNRFQWNLIYACIRMWRCAWHNFQFDRTNYWRVIAPDSSKNHFEKVVSQTTSSFLNRFEWNFVHTCIRMWRCAWHNFQFDRTNRSGVIAPDLFKNQFLNVSKNNSDKEQYRGASPCVTGSCLWTVFMCCVQRC